MNTIERPRSARFHRRLETRVNVNRVLRFLSRVVTNPPRMFGLQKQRRNAWLERSWANQRICSTSLSARIRGGGWSSWRGHLTVFAELSHHAVRPESRIFSFRYAAPLSLSLCLNNRFYRFHPFLRFPRFLMFVPVSKNLIHHWYVVR